MSYKFKIKHFAKDTICNNNYNKGLEVVEVGITPETKQKALKHLRMICTDSINCYRLIITWGKKAPPKSQ